MIRKRMKNRLYRTETLYGAILFRWFYVTNENKVDRTILRKVLFQNEKHRINKRNNNKDLVSITKCNKNKVSKKITEWYRNYHVLYSFDVLHCKIKRKRKIKVIVIENEYVSCLFVCKSLI